MKADSAAIETGTTGLMRSHGPLVMLLAVCFFAACIFPAFRTPGNLANVLRQASTYGLIAIGMTFVILSGGIDLSVGSIAAVASILALDLSGRFGPGAVAAAILAGIAIGAFNGVLVTWVRIPPFIATLATMLGVRGLAFVLAGEGAAPGEAIKVENVPSWFAAISSADVLGLPLPAIILFVVLGVAVVVARYTPFGRSVYAVGGSEEAARMMGLGVNRCKILVYTISGGCAGAAGLLLAARVKSIEPHAAVGWELVAIAAVVVGGTRLTGGIGKIGHTMYGVLVIRLIPNIINHLRISFGISLPPWYNEMITGILLLAVVLLQTRMERRES